MTTRTHASVTVAVTNTRLSGTKRGLAFELALQVARASVRPVCLLGADPTDRDVERRLVALPATDVQDPWVARDGEARVAHVPAGGLYVVTANDRGRLRALLPALQESFSFVVVDAPSRVGSGVGIARALVPEIDLLLVAVGATAGEIAEARAYLRAIKPVLAAHDVDARAVVSGTWTGSGLGPDQIARRLDTIPVVAQVPRLWGRAATSHTSRAALALAFGPIVDLVAGIAGTAPAPTGDAWSRAEALAGRLGRS